MHAPKQNEFLNLLLGTTSPVGLAKVLSDLGDHEENSLDEAFGPHQLCWRAFGGNASNISTIGLGTKPGKSLTERITNAIDAILEERARALIGVAPPDSPRIAAQEWFGRTVTGPEQGLFTGMPVPTDRRISIILLQSGDENAPTVDVIDEGVGLTPEEMPGTILSLQAGNKIRKRYQIGAFGQGGSATLAFAEYAVIVSRSVSNPEELGFTVVRVLRLDATYKEDCYAYLTFINADGNSELFQSKREQSLSIYENGESVKAPRFTHGTLVRHLGYRLSGINKSLGPSPGNLYHYLHYSMFDPVLPFRVIDLRFGDKSRNELVTGGRNRLMRLAIEANASEDDPDARVQVRHHRPMEYITPTGATAPSIGVEYWVIFAMRKKDDKLELRGNSAELFVQPNYPVVGTLNGQVQGELGSYLLREAGLTLLSKHMIVHIDASNADSQIRRQLFSTSREGFKDGPILDGLVNSIKKMLQDDGTLFQIEKELTDRLSKREAASTREEVRQQVTRLLRETGFNISEQAKTDVVGSGPTQPIARPKGSRPLRPDPLPTLPFPGVTKFQIVYPEDILQIHLNDSGLLIVETDADAEYDIRGLIHVRTEPDALEIESKSRLKTGRLRWRLRPKMSAEVGAAGELICSITKTDGTQLVDSRAFEILPIREERSKKSTSQVPPFEISPVSPEEQERWEMLWSDDLGKAEEQVKHAYKVMQVGGKTIVFYSTVFDHYAAMLDKLKAQGGNLLDSFTIQYEIWIAYHAILQQQNSTLRHSLEGDDTKLESYLDEQRALVGRMQVKQALTVAELTRKLIVATAS